MLNQLMWKDYRSQRPVILLALLFLLGPYVTLVAIFGISELDSVDMRNWVGLFANMSIILSQVTMLIMGASIIGSERQDRGMEFLLTLPPSRSRILLGKSLYCLVVAAVILGVLVLANEVFIRSISDTLIQEFRALLAGFALGGINLFCVAWLASTKVRGVVGPAMISLSVTVVILILVSRYAALQDWEIDEFASRYQWHLYPCFLIVSLGSFIAGWRSFVRQYEP